MRRYLGVDPGVTGGFAVLDVHDDGRQELAVHATPCNWVQVGSGKRRRYDVWRLDDALGRVIVARPISLAYLELQSARPRQGMASTFYTGVGFGLWQALLTARAVPYALVPPPRWRALVGLASQPKQAKKAVKQGVRLAACRRFPAVPINLDQADAVMLAVAAALEHRDRLPSAWTPGGANGLGQD